MKKIEWHNPANATPPEGHRLLIPVEVDGRFKGKAQVWTLGRQWTQPHTTGSAYPAEKTAHTYAVPADTPLPEGYALIDGEPWQMDGWTLHNPAPGYNFQGIHPGEKIRAMHRNGEIAERSMIDHWFGEVPGNRGREIIGWRFVDPKPTPSPEIWESPPVRAKPPLMALDAEEQSNKPMTATEAKELQKMPPELLTKWQEELRKILLPLMGKTFESAHRVMLDENQRLKNQLADAQATLKSIRSLLP